MHLTTEVGKRYITQSDFVISRLEAEYKFFTTAATVLEQETIDYKNVQKEDLINAELRKRGIDPEQYAGYQRVSINRKSLQAVQNGKDWLVFVPGTARQQKVILPGDNVVELNERTLIVFIDPNKQYLGLGTKKQLTGAELMASFDDKTARQTRHPSIEAIRTTATTPTIPQPASPAKLKIGETVFAPDHFCNSLRLNEYKVQGVLVDVNGRNLYKLKGEGVPEQILPEEALDRFMFTDAAKGEAYLSAHGKEAADYADTLLAQTMGEQFAASAPSERITYALTLDKSNLVANYGDTCRVKLPGKQVEQMILPAKDVLQQGEHLQITLHSDQTYKVITGAYGYTVSGEGLSKLSGATVQTMSVMVDVPTPIAAAPALPKVGDTLYDPIGSPFDQSEILVIQKHRVVEELTDATGGSFYKLAGEHGGMQIVPASTINEYFFTDQAQLDAYLATHGGMAHDNNDHKLLNYLSERDSAQFTVVEKEPPSSLILNKNNVISDAGEVYQIRLPEADGEIVSVPAKDVVSDGEQLHITLHTDQFYQVQRGVHDYTNLSGHGVAQLTGKTTSVAAKTAANAATQTAATATTTASVQTAVNTTVAAIPVPEPITATAKTIYAAASQASVTAAQTAAQVTQNSLKLTQSIGREE